MRLRAAAKWGLVLVVGLVVLAGSLIHGAPATQPQNKPAPTVVASSPIEAGRYLILVGGCNDCHTLGYMQQGLAVPEDQWLTGLPVGFKGPWGTTYGSNLRMALSRYPSAELFVSVMRARQARPPMPWHALHSMSDQDLSAVYSYIRSLPVKGEDAPAYVPPGEEPKTPYFPFEPQMPAAR